MRHHTLAPVPAPMPVQPIGAINPHARGRPARLIFAWVRQAYQRGLRLKARAATAPRGGDGVKHGTSLSGL